MGERLGEDQRSRGGEHEPMSRVVDVLAAGGVLWAGFAVVGKWLHREDRQNATATMKLQEQAGSEESEDGVSGTRSVDKDADRVEEEREQRESEEDGVNGWKGG